MKPQQHPPEMPRFPPLDIARGMSMLLVIAMHTVLGVEAAAGQRSALHALVDFANAFRVPAFFLLAGLFLRRAMSLSFADLFRKRIYGLIVLFALWSAVHIAIRQAPQMIASPGEALLGQSGFVMSYLKGFIEPFGLLWFLYLMMIFLIVTRVLIKVPAPLVLIVAAGLETARITTGITIVDEFTQRFFYFYCGIAIAPHFFPYFRADERKPARFEDRVPLSMTAILLMLGVWLAGQMLAVQGGYDHWRGFSLIAGLSGMAALIGMGIVLARGAPQAWFTRFLSLIGERSIVIFLVFTIPMGGARLALLALFPGMETALLGVLVFLIALGVSMLVVQMTEGTWAARLFARPVLGGSTSLNAEHRRRASDGLTRDGHEKK